MQIATLRLLITLGRTLGLWFTTAWAVQDNQEAICDQSYVIFCDNFEARALGANDLRRSTYKNGGWEYPFPQSPGAAITNAPGTFFDGTQSLSIGYPRGYNTGGPYLVGWLTAGRPDVYIRWYWKFSSNFIWSSVGNKRLGIVPLSNRGINVMGQKDNNPRMYSTVGVVPDGACENSAYYVGQIEAYLLCQQTNITNFSPNQWYCMEVHVKNNSQPTTSKVADGRITAWINGLQVMDYPNINLDYLAAAGAERDYWPLWAATGMSCSGGAYAPDGFNYTPQNPESYHPEQYRWHDNVVVGTQRIGCLGTPPPPGDTTPRAIPQNLQVS